MPIPKLTSSPPKWHLVYYVLAGFDLLAIAISLFINLQVTTLYVDSVATNKEWAQRLSQYSELTTLATEVNRPGNDIFLTADVEAERKKFNAASNKFKQHLGAIKLSHESLTEEIAYSLNGRLKAAEFHMEKVETSANKILSLFNDDPLLAGNEMARMDHSFFNLTASIARMSKQVQDIQTESLATQSVYAQSLDKYEKAIGAFILVMVLLVALYGHFLSKKVTAFIAAQSAANDKINELNATLENRVIERTAELQRSNQELEQFAYIASHDLREPLRKIEAFGDRLLHKEREQVSDDGKFYIERMQNAAQRMKALIEGLLAYSRLGGHETTRTEVNLNDLVHGIASDFEIHINAVSATVEATSLPTIYTDRLLITQVLQNLIGNALKFKKEDEKPHVTISANIKESMCCIKIVDNGIGIEEQYKDRIFEVFQRLHGRTEYEGTGVGLSICKKAVEQLQGTLTFESKLGHGTTFEVRLPIIKAS